ncbi:MAG: hypothetical protein ACYTFG_06490, partial [Planctomycetota bacterium]|jgi:hypothetical protein
LTLSEAYSGVRGLARWQKIVLGIAAAIIAGTTLFYVLCNEIPSLRDGLPAFLKKTIPWYKTLKSS